MCLITKQKWPKIAWKPIITYKVVYTPDGFQPFLTLYQSFPIRIHNTYKETLWNILKNRRNLTVGCEIHQGIHSTIELSQAKIIAKCFKYYNTKVVECVIPRFSLYWVGADNDIVSNKLKYIKVL